MVQKQTIERIRVQVADCSDERLEQEFEDFFRKQPEICDFVMDITSASSQRVRELSLFLSYVAYKALVLDTGLRRPVPAPTIADASRESQEWIQQVSEMDSRQFCSPSAAGIGDEPYLLGFVATEVQDAIAEGLDLDDDEKGTVFFVLKTVISSMAVSVA